MIRVLIMVAIAGFAVSVVTLGAAVGLAGPEAVLNGAWTWSPGEWGHGEWGHGEWGQGEWGHGSRDSPRRLRSNDEPDTTRQIAWSGGEDLKIDLTANVRYTQAKGPATIMATGPRDAVDDLEIKDGVLRYRSEHDEDPDLSLVITAPTVNQFEMAGAGRLDIDHFHQDRLKLKLDGSADVTAAGEVKTLELAIAGSADADLGSLKAKDALVTIDGSGDAAVAPTDTANVAISGSGEVSLLTRPAKLQSTISGSGRLMQKDGVSAR